MSTQKILLSILKYELAENDENNIQMAGLNAQVYPELFDMAQSHDIAHIIASALSKAGLLGEDEISKKFSKQLMLQVYLREQKNYVLSEVRSIFEKAEIEHILLKGAVICRYYPEEWMRSSCDIDVLIKEQDAECAINVLCKAGYKLQESTSIHDYSLYSPTGVHLELHFNLIQEGCLPQANLILERVWEYTVENDATYCKSLTNEMLVLYHIAHMAKHFLKGGCGIKPFIDLWVLRRKVLVNAEKLEKLLFDAQLLDFHNAVCDVVSVWFEDMPHNNVTSSIEEYVIKGGVYGDINNAAVMKAATGEGKLRYLLRLMIMPRENLEIIYPRLKKYPALFLFYQIKRWFRIFKKDKRESIKYWTDVRNSVSEEEVTSTAGLLNYLGLDE